MKCRGRATSGSIKFSLSEVCGGEKEKESISMDIKSEGTIGWRMSGQIVTWPANLSVKDEEGNVVILTETSGHMWTPTIEGEDVCTWPRCNRTDKHRVNHENT